MNKEFRLKEGQYDTKEKALVEIVEQIEPRITIVTEENILKTITFLEAKKVMIISEIDAEIAINQEILTGVQEEIKKIVI